MVHINQYGFLRSRTIQDCIAWAYEYIHQCQQTKKEILVLKLDFAKAFDTIEHSALLKILECQGFDNKWLSMIKSILGSGTSSILLNGVAGKKFACKRGVRQGDPLSPLLYVAGGDLLQSMVNKACVRGDLSLPLPILGADFPIVQYADDTLIIIEACERQLLVLKNLLQDFSRATGLRVNYSKSNIMPVNVSNDRMVVLAQTFGCSIGVLPFTYLGLPVGTTRPTMNDLTPLMSQVERRLNASARFLGLGGRLQLVNSVLSSLSTYYMCTLKLHKTFIKFCDRARRHCLWAKKSDDGVVSCHSLAAWSMVCKPKKKGGLGIINLELHNKALLLKQLHKFYLKADIPWVRLVWSLYGNSVPHARKSTGSFWWRDVMSLSDAYRSIITCSIKSGQSVLFWKDFWIHDQNLCDVFPRLFSFTLNEDLSVKEYLNLGHLQDIFMLPLSIEAHEEFQSLSLLVADTQLVENEPDGRRFAWGSPHYTAAKYYQFIFTPLPQDTTVGYIWKSRALPKLKVFDWLLFMDRLNTKDMMARRHWNVEGGTDCVLCSSAQLESRDHLFFECSFAKECWNTINIQWDLTAPISRRIVLASEAFTGPCFMEVISCAAWNIWKERNEFIFQGVTPSLARWRVRFQSDLSIHQYRIKTAIVQPLLEWLQNSFV
jgi:mannosylglycoprotein endo-beta-mannosidase